MNYPPTALVGYLGVVLKSFSGGCAARCEAWLRLAVTDIKKEKG